MNIGNLVFLSIAATFVLFIVQRTERKRLWVALLVLLLPTGFLVYRWAIYKDQLQTAIIAGLIGLGLNTLYFVVYGRTHPPVAEEVKVIGSDQ